VDARLLTRCTNVGLVAVVGMTAAHLSMPIRPGASWGARLAFGLALAAAGGLAGWRERREAVFDRGPARHAPGAWVACGAAVALLAGAVAWAGVHR